MFVVYRNFRCLGASNKINRLVRLGLPLALSLLLPTAVQSAVTTYTDEATYLADLSAYTRVSESFEGTAWDSVRSGVLDPQVLPSITNLGLTWQNRFSPVGGVTTSDGGGFWIRRCFPVSPISDLPGRTASLLLVALPPVTVAVLCTMASGSFTPPRTALMAQPGWTARSRGPVATVSE
jgi:hypothetical protein